MQNNIINLYKYKLTGQYLGWDYTALPHLLIIGSSGSGKSYASKILLARISKYIPDAKAIICDFKADDFKYLEGERYYFSFEKCIDGLNCFYDAFEKRRSGQDESRTPRFLFFDEFASFSVFLEKKQSEEMKKKLAILMMLSRSFNMHVIIAVQRGDAEYFQKTRDNFSVVIALGNISKESMAMFGFEKEYMMPAISIGEGNALFNGVGQYPIFVPAISSMTVVHEEIRKLVQ